MIHPCWRAGCLCLVLWSGLLGPVGAQDKPILIRCQRGASFVVGNLANPTDRPIESTGGEPRRSIVAALKSDHKLTVLPSLPGEEKIQFLGLFPLEGRVVEVSEADMAPLFSGENWVYPPPDRPPIFLKVEGPAGWILNPLRLHPWLSLPLCLLPLGLLRRRSKSRPLPSPSATVPEPARRLGRYVLHEQLGEGGMATVFKASPYDQPQKMHALKQIKAPYCKDPEFRRRFRREVKVCRTLSHPNVVSTVDYCEDVESLYLVLEYIAGQTLQQAIPPSGLPLSQACPLMLQLVEGLLCAHSLGVVHRDLKPENIMIVGSAPAGQIKIMDFGLARAPDASVITQSSAVMGTPAYMAPDQMLGLDPAPAADQYSLGVVFFQMLTGRLPFEADDPGSYMHKHMVEIPTIPPDVHPEVGAMLSRMLKKNPGERFPDLLGVKAVLQGLAL